MACTDRTLCLQRDGSEESKSVDELPPLRAYPRPRAGAREKIIVEFRLDSTVPWLATKVIE
jgi:hypothetical protein